MLEIMLCSLVTILPDYLYRRYRQGKRFGHEITLYSVWFELRFGIILIGSVLGVGNLYLHLHTLPERMAHKSQKLQFEIVAVLGLLALFTHNHLFWVIGLFLAMVDLPDFGTPLRKIAGSVEKMAGVPPEADPTETPTETAGHGAGTNSAATKSEAPGHA